MNAHTEKTSNSSTIKRKRKTTLTQQCEKDAQEIALEKMIFGDKSVITNLGKELQNFKISQIDDFDFAALLDEQKSETDSTVIPIPVEKRVK
jgi:hypothetical protein